MIILGTKYKFTPSDSKRLKKKFGKYTIIEILDKNPHEVVTQLSQYIETHGATMLVLNTRNPVHDEIVTYLTRVQFQDKRNKFVVIGISRLLEDYLFKYYISEDSNNLSFLENIDPFNKWIYFQKRCIDYFFVVCLFLFSLPFWLLSAIKIKQQSPGPILFKQDRVGKYNVIFKCLKFRSMHLNTYQDLYTKENDSRIIPFGKLMRKTRLDELPQILNVLKGDMHIIGPRAEWNILVSQYEEQIPYYNERHLVCPGITGLAQVSYHYGANIEDTKQKLMYDLYYIKHWSLLLELKIVWLTFVTVILRKGI